MNPSRIASILTFLWTLIQVWNLVALGYSPSGHVMAWLGCAVMAGVCVGLWFERLWARMTVLVAATAFIIFYAVILYEHGVNCASDPMECYAQTFSQPLLLAVIIVVLTRRRASNNRIDRPREP